MPPSKGHRRSAANPAATDKPRQARPISEPSAARAARPGHGRITLRDVAEVAGVTSITVSRYLRDPAVVAPETAARIRAAITEAGYLPNKQAGLLASGRSNVVAVLLPNLANSIFAETAQGLSDTLQEAGYELLIASTGYSIEREEEQLRALLGWHPAAVVVTGRRHSDATHTLLASARGAGTPVIEIWDHHPQQQRAATDRFTQIGFNHNQVGRAMAEHLIDAGHSQLAYVDSGVAEDYRAHERGVAFAAAARARGATVQVLAAPAGDAFDAGRQALAELLRQRNPPVTAAAFANDNIACGALLEALQRKVAVPQRLALLGFGDFAIGRQLDPALSTVRPPRREIGIEAAKSLLQALRKEQAAASIALPWALIARASTGARSEKPATDRSA